MPPRGPRRDLWVVDVTMCACGTGVKVAGEDLAGDQPGEVGHVDQEGGVDLVGDLAEEPKVRVAGVGGVAGDDHEWTELSGQRPDLVVVQQPGGGVDAVAALLEQLAGDVGTEAV